MDVAVVAVAVEEQLRQLGQEVVKERLQVVRAVAEAAPAPPLRLQCRQVVVAVSLASGIAASRCRIALR